MASDSNRWRTRTIAGLCAAAVSIAGAAHASDPTDEDRQHARDLMNRGRSLREAGDLQGALKVYEDADSIMHVPSTGIAVAKAYAALGQLTEARTAALSVLRLPVGAQEPKPFQEARTAAADLLQHLEPRIPKLMVHVSGAIHEDAVGVWLDDHPLPATVLTRNERVDPGPHTLVIRWDDRDKKIDLVLAEGQEKIVEVDESLLTPVHATQARQRHGVAPLAIAGFSVAAAALAVGTVAGIVTIDKKNSATSGCTGRDCPPATFSGLDSATTMSYVSTASFIVCGAGIVAGVLGLVMHGKSEPAPQARIEPFMGIGSAGISGRF